MLLLLCFAIGYALEGAIRQVGHDSRVGLWSFSGRAWSGASTRLSNMKAKGPRNPGWWAWHVGNAGYHGFRGLRSSVRGARAVGRSAHRGWRAGWQRGKDAHQRHLSRRAEKRGTRAARDPLSGMTIGDRFALWRDSRMPANEDPSAAEPAESSADDEWDQAGEGDSADEPIPFTVADPDTDAPRPRLHVVDGGPDTGDDSNTDTTSGGGMAVATHTGGEVLTYSQLQAELQSIITEATTAIEEAHAQQEQAKEDSQRIETMVGSASSMDVDGKTLAAVAAIGESASAAVAAADQAAAAAEHKGAAAQTALATLESEHAQMHEAVNATREPAKTDFYRES